MTSPRSDRVPAGLFGRLRRGRREASASGIVPAIPQDVWQVVSDVERIERWWPRALGGMIIDGDEAGREQVVRLDWGRQEGRIRQRVIAWEPGRRYGWEIVSESAGDELLPPLAVTTVTIEIEREGSHGSKVSIRGVYDPVGARGVLALRQLNRLARASYRKAIKNLRQVLSAGG